MGLHLNPPERVIVLCADEKSPVQALGRMQLRDLTEPRLRRGIFRNVEEVIMAILEYIDNHNGNHKPFVWNAMASYVLQKITRAHAVLDNR